MRALTSDTPKPLLRVGDESLIERQLKRLAVAGFDEIVVNLSYRGEQIRETLGDGAGFGVRIAYSQEPAPPLAAAGGIVNALSLLGSGSFLLVASDIWTDFDFAQCRGDPKRNLLIMVPNPTHNPDGDFGMAANGLLTQTPPKWTYSGVAVLSTTLFAGLAPGHRALKPVLDAAIERAELCGLPYVGTWLDVGTPERLEAARSLVASGRC